MRVAIDRTDQPVLACRHDESSRLCLDDWLSVGEIIIVDVVGNELLVPEELTGFCVQRDQAIGVKVGSWP